MQKNLKSLLWVGHRGWPEKFPENSLLGLRTALEIGADAVEVDVQITLDNQPIVVHDTDLSRVSNSAESVLQTPWAYLRGISVHEPERFAGQYDPTPICHLSELVQLLASSPDKKLFLEIKSESFDRLSRVQVLVILAEHLRPINQQVYLISYDLYILRLAQEQYPWPVGWVLTHYDARSHARIKHKPVDVVICNIRKIPEQSENLWLGSWQWFLYDITQSVDVKRCKNWQIQWCETWDVGGMLKEDTRHATL